MRSATSAPGPLAAWRFALAFLLPASVLLVLLVASQRADPDLWGRISVGAVLFEAGHLPRADDFSYTASGARWVDHEWLSGVVFYGLLRAGGETALQLFKYAMAACALALVLAVHRSLYRVPPLWGAAALALLAPVYLAAFLTSVRAQVFSIVCFLLTVVVLERARLREGRASQLLWLLPLAVLWGNAHGGFVMGALATALYAAAHAWLGRRRDALAHAALALGMLAAVTFLNPYGPRYLGFLLHAWSLDRTGIGEWEPLLAGPWRAGTAALAAVAAISAGLGLRTLLGSLRLGPPVRSSPASPDQAHPLAPALILLLVVAMSLLARRIHPFMALALALYLPVLAPGLFARWDAGRAALAAAAALPIAACLAAGLLLWKALPARPILGSFVPDERSRVEPRYRYPVGPVRYLRASPYAGRLLNPFTPGEFLYWTLYPRFRVAIDGRYEEVYGRDQFLWITAFYAEHDPGKVEKLAQDSSADAVLLFSGTPVQAALSESRAWRMLYDDGFWALAGRREWVESFPPFRFEPEPRRIPPSIASFFTPADLERFAGYPE